MCVFRVVQVHNTCLKCSFSQNACDWLRHSLFCGSVCLDCWLDNSSGGVGKAICHPDSPRLCLCGWIVPALCIWCKVLIQERANQTVCAMQTCVAKWKCLPKKWHASSPHVEMLTSYITSSKWKFKKCLHVYVYVSVCVRACVWVCMPQHGPSVSVFVWCLATGDACANEGKFSCFIWSWKILAGYVVVGSESPPKALGLAAVVCRVVCWCQRALQQLNPWHYRLLLQHVYCSTHLASPAVVVFTLYPKHMKSKALQTNCAL